LEGGSAYHKASAYTVLTWKGCRYTCRIEACDLIVSMFWDHTCCKSYGRCDGYFLHYVHSCIM